VKELHRKFLYTQIISCIRNLKHLPAGRNSFHKVNHNFEKITVKLSNISMQCSNEATEFS
jgi:hypothetical protein